MNLILIILAQLRMIALLHSEMQYTWTTGTKFLCNNIAKDSASLASMQMFSCEILTSAQPETLQCVAFVSVPYNAKIDWFLVNISRLYSDSTTVS